MVWIVTVREVVFTVATITAIISHAMGSLTLDTSAGVFTGNTFYATLSIIAGEATILTLPLILLYDMVQEKSYKGTVVAEIVWLIIVSIIWIVVGVQTMGVTSGVFKTCNQANATLVAICSDAQTLAIFSLVTGALLLAYTVALTGYGVSSASSGNPIWTSFDVGGKKKR